MSLYHLLQSSLGSDECDTLTFWADTLSYWHRVILLDLRNEHSVYHPRLREDVVRLGYARAALVRHAKEVSP